MLISRPDKDRISAAIAAVEQKTSGEIFCVIARQCGDYRAVPLVWAAALALFLPLPLILFSPLPASWIYIVQLALFAVSAVILSVPTIRFRIVPRRRMQEELLALWDDVRFTLLFVTHSIEEALLVGNRILLLSPHPGRVRAELNSHQFDAGSLGSPAFQAQAQRIHSLLFEEGGAA